MGFFGEDRYADDHPFVRTKHNVTCRELGDLSEKARPDAEIRVDHCAWHGDIPGYRTGSNCGKRYRPDFELIDGNYRVIGEVETLKGLNQRTLMQLEGIRTPGFVPIIVFPADELREGEQWTIEHELEWATVTTPKGASKLIREPSFFQRIFDL